MSESGNVRSTLSNVSPNRDCTKIKQARLSDRKVQNILNISVMSQVTDPRISTPFTLTLPSRVNDVDNRHFDS